MNETPNVPEVVVGNRPEYVWEIFAIFSFFEGIEEVLNQKVDSSNPSEISDRIGELIGYYSSSSQVCASAEWYRNSVYKHEYNRVFDVLKDKEIPKDLKGMTSPSMLKEYIKSRIADFEYVQTRADRINRAITHTIDGLRSMLSNAKNERSMSRHAQ